MRVATYNTSQPHLAIFSRSMSNNCFIKDEILDIGLLVDRNHGKDVKETLMAGFVKTNLLTPKLITIATDRAPTISRFVKGLKGLCKVDQTFPEFWNFHCFIHREQVISKSLNLDDLMKSVVKIVNYIRLATGNSRI